MYLITYYKSGNILIANLIHNITIHKEPEVLPYFIVNNYTLKLRAVIGLI